MERPAISDPLVVSTAFQHLLRTARAHVDRIVPGRPPRPWTAAPARTPGRCWAGVCDLYVLATIEADLAWFLRMAG